MHNTKFIIVMGVSGCGKSTIGASLAKAISAPFLDGDDYHPPANKAKMSKSIPLTDEDRWPWLSSLANAMRKESAHSGRCVAACSALKRRYRDHLQSELGNDALFVHLAGDKQLILDRMNARQHEYMPVDLLDSQFATLEPLAEDEKGLTQLISQPPQVIVKTLERAVQK